MEKKIRVLFLCTGNSCRSQMAEGFLRNMARDKFKAYSAGINPTQVNPLSVKVMNEAGIDISGQKSKSVQEFLGKPFDYVITVCDNAKQACPVFPCKCEMIHWNLEDPAEAQGTEEEKLRVFRKIRDQINKNTKEFIKHSITDTANIKCPECSHMQEIEIPEGSCLPFYKCNGCRKITPAPKDICCVVCAYSDKKCPVAR